MPARLLIAAHGTRSAEGLATTRALADAVAMARPSVAVELCFLDVAEPSLPDALDAASAEVVIVPLLLSAGYHVLRDIPAVAAGRAGVRVAAHLGPDPLIVTAVAQRLRAARRDGPEPAATLLAAVPSSEPDARAEVARAAELLGSLLDRPVSVLPLTSDATNGVGELPTPFEIAVYLLAEGGFLSALRSAAQGRGVVADPIGVHPALVALVWARYDAAIGHP